MGKPFKETKLGKFLTSANASKLIDTVGKVATGNWIGAASNIKDIITGSDELTPEQKETALKLLDQELEYLRLEFDDRKDARAREVALNTSHESSWLSKNTGAIIALIFTVFTCVLFVLVLTGNIKPSENITFSVVTSVTNIFMLIAGYYFGSSRSSTLKDRTIQDLMK